MKKTTTKKKAPAKKKSKNIMNFGMAGKTESRIRAAKARKKAILDEI